jgi:plastocyanin
MVAVKLRRRALAVGAVLLGVAAIVLPAVAGSETTPKIEAVNVGGGIYGEEHHWSPAQATVTAGASVTLSNPSEVPHGVYWVGGPATPSCSSGVPVGTTAAASGTKWSGSCTFATPGVYSFYCTVHGPAMSGRVTVDAAGTTTVTTTPTPAPGLGGPTAGAPVPGGEATTSPQGTPGSPTGTGSPLLGPASNALTLSRTRHGAAVHGSIEISPAGAGGRLEVELLVSSRSLNDSRTHTGSVRVGRFLRASLSAGALSFTIPLTGRARDALEREGHLGVTLRLLLSPKSGPTVRILRRLTLRHR